MEIKVFDMKFGAVKSKTKKNAALQKTCQRRALKIVYNVILDFWFNGFEDLNFGICQNIS